MTIWPIPLPDWYWAWAEWYLGRGAYKTHKRDPKWRPGNVPAKIPYWAWARLAAQTGNPIPPRPPAPPKPPIPTVDKQLALAREIVQYGGGFTGHYLFGGGHGQKVKYLTRSMNLDCSSSVSELLDHFDLLDSEWVQVSGWFESWRTAGTGKYMTVHATGDHVWIGFELPEGYRRFDTSPHGDGRPGPRIRTRRRSERRFRHRHSAGL